MTAVPTDLPHDEPLASAPGHDRRRSSRRCPASPPTSWPSPTPIAAAGYRFRPGQFNMLYLPGVGESAISHQLRPRRLGRSCTRSGSPAT